MHANSSVVGLQSALFPFFDDDEYGPPPEGEPYAERQFTISRCIGNVFSAGFQLADVGVTAVEAHRDCTFSVTGSQPSPLVSAQLALSDLDKLIDKAQANLNLTLGMAQLPAVIAQAKAYNNTLHKVESEVDDAQALLSQVSTTDPNIDLYSLKRLAELRCARDALVITRSVAAASARLSVAVEACPENGPDARCAAQVSAAVSVTALVGAEIDRMVINCRPGLLDLQRCTMRLEALSWQIAAAAKFISGAIKFCGGYKEAKAPTPKNQRDYGWCMGEIFSTMGYAGTTAMWIYNGVSFDCKRVRELIDLSQNRTLTGPENRTLILLRSRCMADYAASVRTLFLTFTKGMRSASHCGDVSVSCGRDILRGTSAFSGIIEAGMRIRGWCKLPDNFTENPNVTAVRVPLCAQESAGLIKMAGLAGSFLVDASGSCVGTRFARTRCGASVLRSLAAMGALVEIYANMHLNCNVREFWFLCGRDMRFSADALRVLAVAIATAALNCPLGFASDAWKATKPVPMPRFFTFP